MSSAQIPIPDQLADVRLKLKELEQKEAELKQMLLANPDLREGAAWLAEIKTVDTSYCDLRELRAMNPDLVAEYTFPKTVTRVVLTGITDEGELIPARRFRKETTQ